MTIEFMDNFSLYGIDGQANMLNGFYGEVTNTAVVASPSGVDPVGTAVLQLYPGTSGLQSSVVRRVLGGNRTKVGMMARFWLSALPGNGNQVPNVANFRNGANAEILMVVITPTGYLEVRNIQDGTTYAATASPVLTANAFWHIETWVTFNAVSGAAIEVRVEGVTVINTTIAAITAPDAAQACLVHARTSNFAGGPPILYVKDFVVCNGLGALNNGFLGSVSVHSLIPDSDVAANWARNTGASNFGNIDESGPPNDDTDYVYAINPAPAADKYGLSDLPVDVTSVKGLMVVHRSRKTDGGDGNVQAGLISGASTQLLADRPITAAYTYFADVSETNPATGAAWLPGAVNAAQLQMNRTL